jgi:sarcosine oxidase / L-pipecolate oxidase
VQSISFSPHPNCLTPCEIAFIRYTDTPDEHWMIGFHPTDKSIVFATGGSGHAYKVRMISASPHPQKLKPCLLRSTFQQFFPIIGRLVADVIQGVLPDDLVAKFAVDRSYDATITMMGSRRERVPELDEDQLCEPEDLLP